MNLTIGETLKRLRKEKDMTQEQLAEYLSISTQAVSRWETNQSLPDITMLPVLAHIFDTTSDVLLGIDIDAKEKRIQQLLDTASERHRNDEDNAVTAELLRAGLKEFPTSYKLMSQLMTMLWYVAWSEPRPDTEHELIKEVVSLGEKIIAECTDDGCRHNAIQVLTFVYHDIGESEKAVALAETMPTLVLSRQILLAQAAKGTAGLRAKQECIDALMEQMRLRIEFVNSRFDDGTFAYTKEENIALYRKCIDLLELMFENGDFGFHRMILFGHYRRIAEMYITLENYAAAIENLNTAADQAIIFDEEYDAEKEHTSLVFRGKKYVEFYTKTVPHNGAKMLLEYMAEPEFDPARTRDDFKDIEARLRRHTESP
ncbi:MAG: helix-turn-helix domain-containing protein [Oscillospiraceae bacterium]|jgi:transcriptional regulator with XRE-family HTH domain|nr:helix-turn-helix domain-containing protein [Oscillospiraceae bacterium]